MRGVYIVDVTIVIPTKNAGRLFEKVLKKVFAQETTYEYEVICVDSGSSDNTIEIIKKFPCKLYELSLIHISEPTRH